MNIDWKCQNTWKQSIKNTLWCLLGCSIGDFGTIYYFQNLDHNFPTLLIMSIAIINGLITSILLETLILIKQKMSILNSFKTAINMSFLSMISMEISMNFFDWLLLGKAMLVWWIVPIMLLAGFITPLPYNYWKLKKYNIACH